MSTSRTAASSQDSSRRPATSSDGTGWKTAGPPLSATARSTSRGRACRKRSCPAIVVAGPAPALGVGAAQHAAAPAEAVEESIDRAPGLGAAGRPLPARPDAPDQVVTGVDGHQEAVEPSGAAIAVHDQGLDVGLGALNQPGARGQVRP